MKKPLSAPRFYLLIWLACVSLAQPFAALAQTNAPAELPPAAQEAMDRGVIAAKNQDYLLAIRFFADARKAAPTQPVLLFNLGLAESKIAGRELRAMAWFGAYLAASPDAANAGAVRTQIKELDVKNLSSLTRLLRTTEDAAKQLVEPASYIPGSIAVLWTKSGDLESAFQFANSIQGYPKSRAQAAIAGAQAKAGDFAGAQRTADSIQDASDKDLAQKAIAEAQAKAGDFAGAQKTVDSIRSEYSKGNTQKDIAQVQAEAGDFVAAQMTVDGIQRADVKVEAQKAIAEAQAISVAKWTEKNEALLSKSVFLDLAAHLKSLPANDADRVFRGLLVTAEQITDARMVITEMLKQQTQQSAKP